MAVTPSAPHRFPTAAAPGAPEGQRAFAGNMVTPGSVVTSAARPVPCSPGMQLGVAPHLQPVGGTVGLARAIEGTAQRGGLTGGGTGPPGAAAAAGMGSNAPPLGCSRVASPPPRPSIGLSSSCGGFSPEGTAASAVSSAIVPRDAERLAAGSAAFPSRDARLNALLPGGCSLSSLSLPAPGSEQQVAVPDACGAGETGASTSRGARRSLPSNRLTSAAGTNSTPGSPPRRQALVALPEASAQVDALFPQGLGAGQRPWSQAGAMGGAPSAALHGTAPSLLGGGGQHVAAAEARAAHGVDAKGSIQVWRLPNEAALDGPAQRAVGPQTPAQPAADTAAGPGVVVYGGHEPHPDPAAFASAPAAPTAGLAPEGPSAVPCRSALPSGGHTSPQPPPPPAWRAASPPRRLQAAPPEGDAGLGAAAAEGPELGGGGHSAAGPLPARNVEPPDQPQRGRRAEEDLAQDGFALVNGRYMALPSAGTATDGSMSGLKSLDLARVEEFRRREKAAVAPLDSSMVSVTAVESSTFAAQPGSPALSLASTATGGVAAGSRAAPSSVPDQLGRSLGTDAEGGREPEVALRLASFQEPQSFRSELERLRSEVLNKRLSRTSAMLREQKDRYHAQYSHVPAPGAQPTSPFEEQPHKRGTPSEAQGSGGGSSSSAGMVAFAEGFQSKLDEVSCVLRAEQRNRELLFSTVADLERRLSDGLQSMGEVASARIATDGATDAMLDALRKCVDELGEQCAWPPPGSAGAGPVGGEPLAPTMAEAVKQQQAQLRQLWRLKEHMQAQHEQELQRVFTQLEHQERRLNESSGKGDVDRISEEVRRAVAEQQQQLQALQQQLTASCNLAASVRGVEERVQQLQAMPQRFGGAAGTDSVANTLQAMEGQMQQLQAEKQQVAEALRTMGEQQQQLQAMQQQLLAAGAGAGSAAAANSGELAVTLHSVEGQLQALQAEKSQVAEVLHTIREQQQMFQMVQQQQEQELKGVLAKAQACEEQASAVQELRAEVTVIASAVNMLCSKVEQLSIQDPQSALQTEIGAIATVVSKLSERVDRIDPKDSHSLASSSVISPSIRSTPGRAPPACESALSPPGGTSDSVETAQALRQQLAVLVGDVRRLSTASSSSPAGGPGSANGDRRDIEEAAYARTRGNKDQVDLKPPAPPQSLVTGQKAPSPRKWLAEPLSVSVARSEQQTSTSSMREGGVDRLVQGSARRTQSPCR